MESHQAKIVRSMAELLGNEYEIIVIKGRGRAISVNDDSGGHCFLMVDGETALWTYVDRRNVDFSPSGEVIVKDYELHTKLHLPGSFNYEHLRHELGGKLD